MKKILIGFVAVFVTLEVLDAIIHAGILGGTYAAMQNTWRPDMMAKLWILHFVRIATAFFFTYVFSKGYEGKGIMEGVRYGFYLGMIVSSGFAFGTYSMFAIGKGLALQWFFYSLIEYIIAGVVVSLVFGQKAAAVKA
jgi:hypothetical protein